MIWLIYRHDGTGVRVLLRPHSGSQRRARERKQLVDSTVQRSGVVAEQRDQSWLGVENAAEPEQLVLYVLDLALTLGAYQQCQAGHVFYTEDQVGGG